MSELLTDIQPLLWPRPGICTDEAMFFRRDPAKTSYTYGKDAIFFELNGTAFFDTYFNSFSVSKWETYTIHAELFLKLKFRGRFQVRLLGYQYRNDAVIPYTFDTFVIESDSGDEAVFRFIQRQECILCGFTLIAMEDDSVFWGGAYCKEKVSSMPEINLALNICTYHRERYVLETLRRLENALADDENAPLRDHVRVYITDNGQTLSNIAPELPWAKIISQNGQGSAGGFARGQLEIEQDADKYGLTHMVFMDDDISLDPRVLLRTYWFLRSLKEEYREHGDLKVPSDYVNKDGLHLGWWVKGVRRAYQNGTLDADRIRALEAIGMVWDTSGRGKKRAGYVTARSTAGRSPYGQD